MNTRKDDLEQSAYLRGFRDGERTCSFSGFSLLGVFLVGFAIGASFVAVIVQ